MKSLKLLIKLKEKDLDAKRRELSEAEINLEKLESASKMLDHELKLEQDVMKSMIEFSFAYTNYYIRNRKSKELIENEITNHQTYIKQLNEQIFQDFTELKKYTIALDNRKKALLFKLQLKEQQTLDELSMNNYIKSQKDS